MDWFGFLRWIHVLAASAWYGEVVVINFILIPLASKLKGENRKIFINKVFPRVFKLASVLAATTGITGIIILLIKLGGRWELLYNNNWGRFMLVGGGLGFILITFHFFLENNMARKAGIGKKDISKEAIDDIHTKLKIVPRLGLFVITLIFTFMMFAVRGFWLKF